jgi:hypothetical protein
VILAAVALLAIFVLADAFVSPPGHEVHSSGGVGIGVQAYPGNQHEYWRPGNPTPTLADVKCTTEPINPDQRCSAPGLSQQDHTLYYVWSGCVQWSGAGAIIPWSGFNVEYFASTRTLVLHCYVGTPWVYFPERLYGVAAISPMVLLAIPTSAIGGGPIAIHEDDRLEHLVGDQSSEYPLATATIA